MSTLLRVLWPQRYLLFFAFLLAFLSGYGQTYFISLFGGELRAAFTLSHAGFGGLYSLATLMSGVLVIIAGRGVDRAPLPLFTAGVMLGAAGGAILLASAQAAWMLVPAFLLLRLCGQGLMIHVAQTAVARRVQARRGTAISLVTMGLPAGEALLPSGVVLLIGFFGWRDSWLVLAALLLFLALPLALMLLRFDTRLGRQLVARAAEAGTEPAHVAAGTLQDDDDRRDWTRAEVLRDLRFYLILPALLAPPFLITALFFHQVPIGMARGWTLQWISTAFVAFAVSHVSALFLSGPLVDWLGARRVLNVYLLPMLTALLVLAFMPGDGAALIYLSLAGLSVGTAGTLMGALWPELYGLRHLGGIRAMAQGLMVLSTAAAPVIVGLLLDAAVTITHLALLMSAYVVTALLLLRVAQRVSPPAPSAPR